MEEQLNLLERELLISHRAIFKRKLADLFNEVCTLIDKGAKGIAIELNASNGSYQVKIDDDLVLVMQEPLEFSSGEDDNKKINEVLDERIEAIENHIALIKNHNIKKSGNE